MKSRALIFLVQLTAWTGAFACAVLTGLIANSLPSTAAAVESAPPPVISFNGRTLLSKSAEKAGAVPNGHAVKGADRREPAARSKPSSAAGSGAGRQLLLDESIDGATLGDWSRRGLCRIEWAPARMREGLSIRIDAGAELAGDLAMLATGTQPTTVAACFDIVFPAIDGDQVWKSDITPRLIRNAAGEPAILTHAAPPAG